MGVFPKLVYHAAFVYDMIINPRRTCAVRVKVSVSVTTFSATARYNAHNLTYHQLQRDMRFEFGIFSFKMLYSGIMEIFAYSTKAAIFLALLSMHIPTLATWFVYCRFKFLLVVYRLVMLVLMTMSTLYLHIYAL